MFFTGHRDWAEGRTVRCRSEKDSPLFSWEVLSWLDPATGWTSETREGNEDLNGEKVEQRDQEKELAEAAREEEV